MNQSTGEHICWDRHGVMPACPEMDYESYMRRQLTQEEWTEMFKNKGESNEIR